MPPTRTTRKSTRRSPLPDARSKAAKRAGGRGGALPTASIRVTGTTLSADARAAIRDKLGASLRKFGGAIERVTVRVTDANGPRGGIDQVCQVKVVVSGLPSIVVERRHARLAMAIGSALRATEQAVRRTLGRRRVKPLRRRSPVAPA